MKIDNALKLAAILLSISPQVASAQSFTEYGRILGSVGGRQSSANSNVGKMQSTNRGKAVMEGVGDLGGRRLPSTLIVESKKAGLYRRQDEQSEQIAELSQGDSLTPVGQIGGRDNWYMVKTQQGAIGWIKSSNVSGSMHK